MVEQATRKLVIVESPFKGSTHREQRANIKYARACLHDCLVNRNEAPFASHLLYTQDGVLNDAILEERMQGIEAGFEWRSRADKTAAYTDRGISKGMKYGIKHAQEIGQEIEYRTLPPELINCGILRRSILRLVNFFTNTIAQVKRAKS